LLPRKPSVRAILESFVEHEKAQQPAPKANDLAELSTLITEMTVYFDKALGMTLLCKTERQQYG
jgi:hypothetical protein